MTTFESTICYHVRYDAPGRTRILTDEDGNPLLVDSPDVDQILCGGPGCTRALVDDYGVYGNPPGDRFRRLAAHAEAAAGELGWGWAGASHSPGWWCPGCIIWRYGDNDDYYERCGLKARTHGM